MGVAILPHAYVHLPQLSLVNWLSHLETLMAEGTVRAVAGKAGIAGAKTWLALEDDFSAGHFLTRAALDR